MITAQEARDLVAAKEDIASALSSIEQNITEAATAGLFSVEYSIEDEALAGQMVRVLINLGYEAHHETVRSVLKVRW